LLPKTPKPHEIRLISMKRISAQFSVMLCTIVEAGLYGSC